MDTRPFLLLAAALALSAGCSDKSGDTGSTANLFVSGLLCSAEGGQVSCDVLVENGGGVASGPFRVSLYLDHPGEPSVGEGGDDMGQITDLEPGAVSSLTLGGPSCGDCAIWAMVDSEGAVEEADESDNTSGPTSVGG